MRHMTLASLVLLEGPPISSHSGTSTVYSRPWLILIITENFTVTFGIFHRNKAKCFCVLLAPESLEHTRLS